VNGSLTINDPAETPAIRYIDIASPVRPRDLEYVLDNQRQEIILLQGSARPFPRSPSPLFSLSVSSTITKHKHRIIEGQTIEENERELFSIFRDLWPCLARKLPRKSRFWGEKKIALTHSAQNRPTTRRA